MRITPDRFRYLAMAIKTYFPAESPYIYYVPGVSLGHRKKINPRGKLFEAYARKRRVFVNYGLCEKLTRRVAENTEGDVPQLTVEDQAVIDNYLEWLKLQFS